MTISIASDAVPQDIREKGQYMFQRRPLGRPNGMGLAYPTGSQIVIWRFPVLYPSEMEWWYDTALDGEESRTTTFTIWDHFFNELEFTEGTIYAPRPGLYKAGTYRNVVINIVNLLPLVVPSGGFTPVDG